MSPYLVLLEDSVLRLLLFVKGRIKLCLKKRGISAWSLVVSVHCATCDQIQAFFFILLAAAPVAPCHSLLLELLSQNLQVLGVNGIESIHCAQYCNIYY